MNDFIKFVENYQHKTDLTLVFLRDMSTENEYFYSVFISCKWDIETPCIYKDFKKIDLLKESKIIDKFKAALSCFNIKSKWEFENL